ncbi:hypothetical protein M747DRAFT_119420 [Aspergillus niger ATCC 13496]|uniref:Uncharacterized protein n=3 Tax=Aspergillus niger TaxID=5061 RepID=A2QX79_ASPNC|nr:hypothetical protein An11g07940 [Aspergillus niger]RDH16405.1 hypothetical protein M747DRAFT_119420 [Aspergillus niger ATCC 13496]CAK45987.1 hypothetical protein An11g07940 [Aspergillus niger]
MIGYSSYSIQPLWLVLIVLSSPAVAQGVLNSVDSQDGDGESESYSTTRSVSSKGMIILCTIVALVLVIGVLFTVVFITVKKRSSKTSKTPFSQNEAVIEATERPLSGNTPTERDASRSKTSNHAGIQPDIEKNAGVDQGRPHRNAWMKQRGWGSYFSFGRA